MYTRAQLADYVERISLVEDQDALINAMLDVALRRVYQYHDWPYYLDFSNGVITTIDDYTTGTIDVTNASTSVAGTGTTFTAAMVDRKIRVQGEKAYYRISAFNAASGAGALTITPAYQGDTDTGLSFEIFKDEYRLNPDVDRYKSFRQLQSARMVLDISPKNFDTAFPMPQSYSDPYYAVDVGNDTSNYTTGTVSATGSIITGAGSPAWTTVEGLANGSKIRIGSNWYTVESVDSATQITTYETVGTIAAGTAYEISLNNIMVQFYPIPNAARNLYYRYFRLPKPLAQDNDLPDMPYDYHHLLMWGALSEILSHKGDINKAENMYEARFLNGLERMKLKIGNFVPDRINARKSCDTIKRPSVRGLESPFFDRSYSA